MEGDVLSDEERRRCAVFFATSSSNDLHGSGLRERMRSLLRDQPTSPALLARWTPRLRQPDVLPLEAECFLREVLASIESISPLITESLSAGMRTQRTGDISDYRIRRPPSGPHWCLQLTTEGEAEYNCMRQSLTTRKGTLILMSPEAHYDYDRAPQADCWQHRWVHFLPEPHWLRWLRWPSVGPGIHHLESADTADTLITLHQSIMALLPTSSAAQALRTNLLEQLLLRCFMLMPESHTAPLDERVERVQRLIGAHLADNLSVEHIAGHVGLSPSRLAALFKQQTGTSLVQWREERRMQQACRLLLDSNQPISRIATQLGYRDPLYFSRCFRQQLGMSPRDYRQQFSLLPGVQ